MHIQSRGLRFHVQALGKLSIRMISGGIDSFVGCRWIRLVISVSFQEEFLYRRLCTSDGRHNESDYNVEIDWERLELNVWQIVKAWDGKH